MTLNNDVFVRKPLTNHIPNDGVTEVGMPTSGDTKQWDVLRYELESFVCEGEYEHGLQRILDSYLRNRQSSVQQAVWVSGFYGSGKSHLVRVLEHLWADTRFPNGATARGLASLPAPIVDSLTELNTVARRDGAPAWSAAGSLDAATSLNAAFLSIVLRTAGLPTQIAPAQVALWLADEGLLDGVAAHLSEAGRELRAELALYNLSRPLSEAILAVAPDFAATAADVRGQLKNQFPDLQSVSIDTTAEIFGRVLRFVGKGVVPPTLVVLDEVQQYIGDDPVRSGEAQQLAERVTKGFDGKVLLVGTGQQELVAHPLLAKIQDRFTVRVTLRNQEIDAVIRQVLLAKEPAATDKLQRTLEGAAGEISRQLSATTIGQQAGDAADLVADYPLLPSRRRFWEHVLRQADAGRAGQLRSQLRIVHEANRGVANEPVGTVVPADVLYEQKQDDLNGGGHLLKETQTLIAEQRAKDADRGRILGLIYLISLLPTSGAGDIGVRATADHLADLLVSDLASDGARLREAVPRLLSEMASPSEGILQQVGDEYQLRTKTWREWEKEFDRRRAQLPAGDVATQRDTLLRDAVRNQMPKNIAQGGAKVARSLAFHDGEGRPDVTDAIPIWLRSEWDGASASEAEALAGALGLESPIVLVHVPRRRAEIEDAIRTRLAAQQVLDHRGRPKDEEGVQAYRSMEERKRQADDQIAAAVRGIVAEVRVLLGGGGSVDGTALSDRLTRAAQSAATRLYPQFGPADDPRWDQVRNRVQQGSAADALRAVGHDGDAMTHPVVKEVFGRIKQVATTAAEIEQLQKPPYGWPPDAVRGAIAVLVELGGVKATINGSDAPGKQVAALTRLGGLALQQETVVVTKTDKLRARQMASRLGIPAADDEDLPAAIAGVIGSLTHRAAQVSGEAPLPLVQVPAEIAAVRDSSGNARIAAFLARADEIEAFTAQLGALEARTRTRVGTLTTARALADASTELEPAREARERLAALEQGRDLLAETDPVTPIVTDLTSALRDALRGGWERLEARRSDAATRLQQRPEWSRLDESEQASLLAQEGLAAEEAPDLSTPAAVLAAARRRPLSAWRDACDAVSAKAEKALAALLARTAPKARTMTVTLPSEVLHDAQEVDAYLATVRAQIEAAFGEHDVVVVTGR